MHNLDSQTKRFIAIRDRECIKIFCCVIFVILGVVLVLIGVYTEENELDSPMKISGFSLIGIGCLGVIGFSIPLCLMSCSKSDRYDKHVIVEWTPDNTSVSPLVDPQPAARTTICASNNTPYLSNSMAKQLPRWAEDSQVIELPPSYKDVYPSSPRRYNHTML